VFLSHILDERDNLESSGRIETRSGLIEEEDLGASDELSSDTDTALLTTGDTLSYRCTDQCVSLTVESERVDECLDAGDTLTGADGVGQ